MLLYPAQADPLDETPTVPFHLPDIRAISVPKRRDFHFPLVGLFPG